MYYLGIISFLASFLISVSACSGSGPVTPVEAYRNVMVYINEKDYNSFYDSLSAGTKDKLVKYKQILDSLEKKQLAKVSSTYGLPERQILSLNNKELAALVFLSERSRSSLLPLLKEKIGTVNISGAFAEISTEKGRIIVFVKEGPYWKIDLSDL